MFLFICFPPSYYPEADGAYILFASGRVGLYHPGVNRGWGDPTHHRILIPVSTMETSTLLYKQFL